MPTTNTLTPNADDAPNNWEAAGPGMGADDQWEALADALDTTYIEQVLAGVFTDTTMGFGTFSIPAGNRVRYVQPQIRASICSGTGVVLGYRMMAAGADEGPSQGVMVYTGGAHTPTDTGAVQIPTTPLGAPWAQADIDALRVRLKGSPSWASTANACGSGGRVYRLRVDVVHSAQPAVNVLTPSGAVANNPQPTVTATTTADDPITAWEVKIYSAAQYGAGGFNPDTSTPTWGTSGAGAFPGAGVQVGVPLANATSYRAYVRVNAPMLGEWWSAWDFEAFSITYTAPNAPALACLGQSPQARVRLTVTPSGSGVVAEFVEIERSTTSSAGPWEYVRGGDRLVRTASVVWYDADSPNGQQTWYRARVIDTSLGVDVPSAWSTVTSCSWAQDLDPDCEWWAAATTRPSLSRSLVLAYGGLPTEEYPVRQGVHYVLGRRNPIVTESTRQGSVGELTILVEDLADLPSIQALLENAGIITLHSAGADTWASRYIAVGRYTIERPPQLGPRYRLIRVAYVEVDSPGGGIDPAFTWVP